MIYSRLSNSPRCTLGHLFRFTCYKWNVVGSFVPFLFIPLKLSISISVHNSPAINTVNFFKILFLVVTQDLCFPTYLPYLECYLVHLSLIFHKTCDQEDEFSYFYPPDPVMTMSSSIVRIKDKYCVSYQFITYHKREIKFVHFKN